MPKEALLMLDFEHIKEYIFGTGKLKEIRGASAILDEFNRIHLKRIIDNYCKRKSIPEEKARPIYAGGGAALYIVPLSEAEDIFNEIAKDYKEKTVCSTIAGSWIEYDSCENKFQDCQRELIRQMHEHKFHSRYVKIDTIPSFVKICESCGKLPAQKKAQGDDDTLICEACWNKRKKNTEIRYALTRSKLDSKLLWGKISSHFGDSVELESVEDFSDLGDMCSTRSGYMGLIYCDGNNMGRYIEKNLKSAEDFTAFSEKVERVLFESVMKAVDLHLRPHNESNYEKLAFDVLILGGDDLMMVMPADKAVEVAITISEAFNKDMQGTDITLSTGLVIAKDAFPFNQYREIAEDLLKSAKTELAYRILNGQRPSGMINFMVISASGSLKFSKENFTVQSGDDKLIKTARPYTLEEMQGLVELIKEYKEKGIPSSPLGFLRQTIDQPDVKKLRSTLAVMDLLSRSKHRKSLEKLFTVHIPASYQNTFRNSSLPPWVKKGPEGTNDYETPIIDFTDLYDFIS